METYLKVFIPAILPIIIIAAPSIPNGPKGALICFILLMLIIISYREKVSLKELGLRIDNLKEAFMTYFLFTLAGVLLLIIFARILNKESLSEWWQYSHQRWFFVIVSVIQEFVYRSYGQNRLQKVMSPLRAIIVIALLFSGMHVLWRDPAVLTITFIGGLAGGYLWHKYPNLFLIIISHSILNFVTVYLGFFPWLITDFFNLK